MKAPRGKITKNNSLRATHYLVFCASLLVLLLNPQTGEVFVQIGKGTYVNPKDGTVYTRPGTAPGLIDTRDGSFETPIIDLGKEKEIRPREDKIRPNSEPQE